MSTGNFLAESTRDAYIYAVDFNGTFNLEVLRCTERVFACSSSDDVYILLIVPQRVIQSSVDRFDSVDYSIRWDQQDTSE